MTLSARKALMKFLLRNPGGVVILGILSGIATNLLTSFAPQIYPLLAKNISVPIFTIILSSILGFFIALLPVSIILRRSLAAYHSEQELHEKTKIALENKNKENEAIKQDYETENKIIEIDRKLLDSLSKLAKGNDPGQEFDTLATRILDAISKIHDLNDSGISIFCPDPKDKDYLISWKSCYTESHAVLNFYIGNVSKRRGIAGEVYKDKQKRIVHIDVDAADGKIKSDDGLYEVFPGQGTPRYRSFICIPIVDTDGNSLGVLSIDSKDRTAFDSDKVQGLANLIANRLGAILLVTLNILPKP
jgi:transcriptional regulator with GAF, ATPase, and Fis domain